MRINTLVEFKWNPELKQYEEIYCEFYEYHGEIAYCGGGGGTSGAVEHPSYIEKTYQILVAGDTGDPANGDFTSSIHLLGALSTVLDATNPYETAAAFSPDPFIALDQEQFQQTEDALIDSTPTIDIDRWEALHDSAKGKADAIFIGDNIDAQVNLYADKTIDEFNTNINRFSAGMAEANAVHSSAFIIGMSLIESQRVRDINSHRTLLTIENEKAKTEYMKKAIGDMVNLMNMHMGNRLELLRWQTEIGRLGNIAKSEQFSKDIEYDREDALWDITAIQKAANIMAAPGGGTALPEKPSSGASAMSGALSGAATGAAIGGPVGAGIGAVLGGIGGLL
jgi:hypothetical protein